MNIPPNTKTVDSLPDLITESDYLDPPDKKKVRIKISITSEGVDLLSDSMYPVLAEDILREISDDVMEYVLCG
jgi:hypothetical protein